MQNKYLLLIHDILEVLNISVRINFKSPHTFHTILILESTAAIKVINKRTPFVWQDNSLAKNGQNLAQNLAQS